MRRLSSVSLFHFFHCFGTVVIFSLFSKLSTDIFWDDSINCNKSWVIEMKTFIINFFFFGNHLKNLAKTTWPFLTGFQFSFLYLFDCPGFLSKKYCKSNYNILENCHYFMFSSHFLFILFFHSTTWQPVIRSVLFSIYMHKIYFLSLVYTYLRKIRVCYATK